LIDNVNSEMLAGSLLGATKVVVANDLPKTWMIGGIGRRTAARRG